MFLAYMGQMTLNPIIAPLAREVGLAEWQIGVTISTAAVMVVTTSQFWGRRSQSRGRKPVLIAALALASGSMALFAGVALLGIAGAVTGTALFLAFVLLRGLGFGAAIAAVPPTAQAYIADVTHDEATRVKGMAGVGAVQGVAMVAGAVAGGALSALGLMAPLIAVPILIGLGLGIAMPGYTAGPTLLMRRDEQGGLAGLIGATNGLTFVVAPTASTALYGVWTPLPIIVAGVVMSLVAVFVVVHPRFRQFAPRAPEPVDA